MCGIIADDVGREIDGKNVKVDLDRQILKPLCGTGKMFCYDSPESLGMSRSRSTIRLSSWKWFSSMISVKKSMMLWKAIRTDAIMRESRQFLMIMVVTAIAL